MGTRRFSLLSACLKSHYDALGITPKATQADIKAAYYKLSKLYHPDKNNSEEATKKFRDITDAYEVIGNYKMRKLYDRGLLAHGNFDSGSRTYSNYNPTTSHHKNKPAARGKSTAYDFDSWTESHYGSTFARRNKAKERFDEEERKKIHRTIDMENLLGSMLILSLVTIFFSMISHNHFDKSYSISSLESTEKNPDDVT